jgi:hypothetical protein
MIYLRGVFLTCAEFLPTKLWDNVEHLTKSNLSGILFFDIKFFKYFFRVLHEASSSWLKFGHAFQ